MATLLLTAVASAAASSAGLAAGSVGASLLATGASIAGGIIDQAFQPKPPALEGPRLDDLSVSIGSEGEAIREIYGEHRVPGVLVWATNLREQATTEEVGGKGGLLGGGQESTTYSYFASFAHVLCEGEIEGIGTIYADGKPLDDAAYDYRIYMGTEDQEADPLIEAVQGEDVSAMRGTAYIVWDDLPLEKFGNRIPQLSYVVIRSVGGTLVSTLNAIAAAAGVTLDASRISDAPLAGYMIDRPMTDRERIVGLSVFWLLELIEDASETLRLVPKYGEPNRTLTRDQIAAPPDGGDSPTITHIRDHDLPVAIRLTAVDIDRSYQPIVVESAIRLREGGSVVSEVTTMVLTEGEAVEAAARATIGPALSRHTLTTSLMPSLYDVRPGEILAIPDSDGRLWRILVSSVSGGSTIDIEGRGCPVDAVALQAATSGRSVSAIASVPTAPVVFFLDLPLLTGNEQPHSPHVAATAEVFQGVSFFRSVSGTNFRRRGLLQAEATTGTLVDALPPGPEFTRDDTNTILVDMDHGTFESVLQADLEDGLNILAILADDGEWEIIQFLNAALVGEGRYSLTGLWRARRGTEAQMNHLAGARVVQINPAVEQLSYPADMRDVAATYLVGPSTRSRDDPLYSSVTVRAKGAGLRPYSPIDLTAVRNPPGSSAVELSWMPRSRIPSTAQPGDQEPDPEILRYEIVANGTTYTTDEPFLTVTDTSATQGPFTFSVRAIGRTYGPGPARSASIPIPPYDSGGA